MIRLRADHFSVCLRGPIGSAVTSQVSFSLAAGCSVALEDDFVGARGILFALGGALEENIPDATTTGTLVVSPNNLSVAIVGENPWSQTTGLKNTAFEELIVPLELQGKEASTTSLIGDFYSKAFAIHSIRASELEWLSGGELQRLHLASALTLCPDLLLLDHVDEELDPEFKASLWSFLKSYARVHNCVIVSLLTPGTFRATDFDELIRTEHPPNNKAIGTDGGYNTYGLRRDQVPTLSVRNLSIRYSLETPTVLKDVSFDVSAGQLAFVVGPNGSGKTTIARAVNGLLPKQSILEGQIELLGTSLNLIPESERHRITNIAFQNPDPYFCCSTVEEEIQLGGAPSNLDPTSDLIGLLDLYPYLKCNPFDVPRGIRKRLSLLLSAQKLPRAIFLDEPTQYQDEAGFEAVLATIYFLLKKNIAVICISHDERLFRRFTAEYERRISLTLPQTHQFTCADDHTSSPVTEPEIFRFLYERWEQLQNVWPGSLIHIVKHWTGEVYPQVDYAISTMQMHSDEMAFVDFGCGVAWQTFYSKHLIEKNAFKVSRMVGLDFQKRALDCANVLFRASAGTQFKSVDLSASDCAKTVGMLGSFELATAFFVLHDLPNCDPAIHAMSQALRPGGYAMVVMLNPLWISEHAESEGVEKWSGWESTQNCSFEWAGTFAIRNYINGQLHVPYFHRPLERYLNTFEKAGLSMNTILITEPGGSIVSLGTNCDQIKRTAASQTILLIGKK